MQQRHTPVHSRTTTLPGTRKPHAVGQTGEKPSEHTRELRPNNRRLEFFSDAVFAISLTVMMLEIRVPDGLASGDRAAIEHFLALVATYGFSFLIITILWTSHDFLVFTVQYPDRATVWLNNLALFCVTLVPIATRYFGLHPTTPLAAALYGFALLLCTASFSLLRGHIMQMTRDDLRLTIHRRVLHKTWIAMPIYLVSIPLAFVDVWLAVACFAIPPFMFFLPPTRRPRPLPWMSGS